MRDVRKKVTGSLAKMKAVYEFMDVPFFPHNLRDILPLHFHQSMPQGPCAMIGSASLCRARFLRMFFGLLRRISSHILHRPLHAYFYHNAEISGAGFASAEERVM